MSTSRSLSPHFTNDAALDQAASWLSEAKRLTVFTVAGVSAASGIQTCREHDGLWDTIPPEMFG